MLEPLLVTAELAGGLAGHAPQLDALLIELAAHRAGSAGHLHPVPRRDAPAPHPNAVPRIPLAREEVGGWPVYRVSAPILGAGREWVTHFVKRIDASRAGLLRPDRRLQVCHTNGWTKAYRLPLRTWTVPAVGWLCVGNRRGLWELLPEVRQLGAKLRHGHGRVLRWRVEPADADCSWFAPYERGQVLMRSLPWGDWLPGDLVGARREFGACCPPYWHRDRYAEVVVPC